MHLKEIFQLDTAFFETSIFTSSGLNVNIESCFLPVDSQAKENIELFERIKSTNIQRKFTMISYIKDVPWMT